jgi:hypothetical protein
MTTNAEGRTPGTHFGLQVGVLAAMLVPAAVAHFAPRSPSSWATWLELGTTHKSAFSAAVVLIAAQIGLAYRLRGNVRARATWLVLPGAAMALLTFVASVLSFVKSEAASDKWEVNFAQRATLLAKGVVESLQGTMICGSVAIALFLSAAVGVATRRARRFEGTSSRAPALLGGFMAILGAVGTAVASGGLRIAVVLAVVPSLVGVALIAWLARETPAPGDDAERARQASDLGAVTALGVAATLAGVCVLLAAVEEMAVANAWRPSATMPERIVHLAAGWKSALRVGLVASWLVLAPVAAFVAVLRDRTAVRGAAIGAWARSTLAAAVPLVGVLATLAHVARNEAKMLSGPRLEALGPGLAPPTANGSSVSRYVSLVVGRDTVRGQSGGTFQDIGRTTDLRSPSACERMLDQGQTSAGLLSGLAIIADARAPARAVLCLVDAATRRSGRSDVSSRVTSVSLDFVDASSQPDSSLPAPFDALQPQLGSVQLGVTWDLREQQRWPWLRLASTGWEVPDGAKGWTTAAEKFPKGHAMLAGVDDEVSYAALIEALLASPKNTSLWLVGRI